VLPTVGVFLFFLLIPNRFPKEKQLIIISLVFIFTYIVPIFLLIILKGLKIIQSFQVQSIKERKIPIIIMILVFYFLGQAFYRVSVIREISYLFYATSLGLVFVYLLFLIKLKASLHLLSMGIAIGFFLMEGMRNGISLLPLIIVLLLLSGLVASSRLYLKAHTPKEIYSGFFIGLIVAMTVFYLL